VRVGDMVRFSGSSVFTEALRQLPNDWTDRVGIVVDVHLRFGIERAEILWPHGGTTCMRADIFTVINSGEHK
jgi:hypothetical protein